MNNRIAKYILPVLGILVLMVYFQYCTKSASEPKSKDGDDENNIGNGIFWTSQASGWSSIDINIDGAYAGQIQGKYFNSTPNCGASGGLTISKSTGSYSFTAKSNTGVTWSGTIKISAGECQQMRLDFPANGNTGSFGNGSSNTQNGNATFWTSQATGWSSIDVTVGGVAAGTISGKYFTSTPSCGSSGTVTISKMPGSYAYTARSNTGTTWSGNVTVTSGGCSTVRLDFPSNNGSGNSTTQNQITFWTAASKYGQIQIYVNNAFKGTITSYYSSKPSCGASGCVTVAITGTGNTWSAKAGNYTWNSTALTLTSACTTMELK